MRPAIYAPCGYESTLFPKKKDSHAAVYQGITLVLQYVGSSGALDV